MRVRLPPSASTSCLPAASRLTGASHPRRLVRPPARLPPSASTHQGHWLRGRALGCEPRGRRFESSMSHLSLGVFAQRRSSRLLTDTTGVRVLHTLLHGALAQGKSVRFRTVRWRFESSMPYSHRGKQTGKAAGMRGRCVRVRLPSPISALQLSRRVAAPARKASVGTRQACGSTPVPDICGADLPKYANRNSGLPQVQVRAGSTPAFGFVAGSCSATAGRASDREDRSGRAWRLCQWRDLPRGGALEALLPPEPRKSWRASRLSSPPSTTTAGRIRPPISL
jgi:hypothetical protein